MQNFISRINLPITIPITIYCDNQSIIKLSKHRIYHSRTEHFSIQQLVRKQLLSISFLSSSEKLVDILAKLLRSSKFSYWKPLAMPVHPCPSNLFFFLLLIFLSQILLEYVSNKTLHNYLSKEPYFQLQPKRATHQDHKQAKRTSSCDHQVVIYTNAIVFHTSWDGITSTLVTC